MAHKLLCSILLGVLIFLVSGWAHIWYAQKFGDPRPWWNSSTAFFNSIAALLLFNILYEDIPLKTLKETVKDNLKVILLVIAPWGFNTTRVFLNLSDEYIIYFLTFTLVLAIITYAWILLSHHFYDTFYLKGVRKGKKSGLSGV